jgi:hypothetical protein
VTLESVIACCCTPPEIECCAFTSVLGAYASFAPLSVNALDMGDGTYLQTGRLNFSGTQIIPGAIEIFPSLLTTRTMQRSNAPQSRCGYRFTLQSTGPFGGWRVVGTNSNGFIFRVLASNGAILQQYGGGAQLVFGLYRAYYWVCPFRFNAGTWHYEIGLEVGGLAVGAIAQYPSSGCPNGLNYGDGNSASSNAYRGCARPIPLGDSWGYMATSPSSEWFRPWPSVSLSASVT